MAVILVQGFISLVRFAEGNCQGRARTHPDRETARLSGLRAVRNLDIFAILTLLPSVCPAACYCLNYRLCHCMHHNSAAAVAMIGDGA
jgi:hypothetical protein